MRRGNSYGERRCRNAHQRRLTPRSTPTQPASTTPLTRHQTAPSQDQRIAELEQRILDQLYVLNVRLGAVEAHVLDASPNSHPIGLLTVKMAAHRLNMSTDGVMKRIYAGKLPATKICQ